MRHHPGKIISLPPSSSAITTPNPNTSPRRSFHSLTAHTRSHATKGHANCGLTVANPSNTPPQNKNPPATHADAPASTAPTSKLNCCSLIPCTAGTHPNVSAATAAIAREGKRYRSALNHNQTLAVVSPSSTQ